MAVYLWRFTGEIGVEAASGEEAAVKLDAINPAELLDRLDCEYLGQETADNQGGDPLQVQPAAPVL